MKNVNVKLLVSSNFISRLGSSMSNIAFIFGILSVTSSKIDLGLAFTCKTLPFIFFLLYGTAMSGKTKKITIIIRSEVARGVSQLIIGYTIFSGSYNQYLVLLSFFVFGVGEAFFLPSASALVPLIARKDDIKSVNSYIGIYSSIARISGPLIAGLLIEYFNPGLIIIIDGFTYFLSSSLYSMMHVDSDIERKDSTSSNFLSKVRHPIRIIRSSEWLKYVLIQLSVLNILAFAPFTILGPSTFLGRTNGPLTWGSVIAFSGIGSLIGSLVIKRFTINRPVAFLELFILLLSVPLIIISFSSTIPLYIVAGIIYGMAITVIDLYLDISIQRTVRNDMVAQVTSLFIFSSVAMSPIGFLLSGYIGSYLGIRNMLISSSAIIIIYSASMIIKFYKVKE
jgi:MFS family permease|nr:MFS transporter [Acidithiobacillus sp. S30A2]